MAQNKEALRALMRQYIRSVYSRALEKTGTQENAMIVTKRTMSLMARAAETGMAIDEALVLRMADDFCADLISAERPEPALQPASTAERSQPQPNPTNTDERQIPPTKERYQVKPIPDLFDEEEEDDDISEEEEVAHGGVGTVLVIMFLSLLIVAQIVALCVILISRGILHLPGIPFLNDFANWFQRTYL